MNNPFSKDERFRKMENQLQRCKDKENNIEYTIKHFYERHNRKFCNNKSPIAQIIDLCDEFWKDQATYSRLAETNRAEWLKCIGDVRSYQNALNGRDADIVNTKAALREKEQEARVKLREHRDAGRKHEDETRNFLRTISHLNEQIGEIKSRDTAEVISLHDEHRSSLDRLKAEHGQAFEQQHNDHAWAVQAQKEQYEQDIANQRNYYEQQLQHKDIDCAHKIASLEADLLSNSDDFRPATDDVLKVKYRKIKLLIDTITDPFNLGASGVTHLSTRLDPTDFLPREGNKFLRFLLRSVIWGIVMDGFFSLPFGFGALGPESGRQQLFDVYRAWHRLYSAGNETGGFRTFPLLVDQTDVTVQCLLCSALTS